MIEVANLRAMIRAPSGDPSSVQDGRTAEATPERGDDTKPPDSVELSFDQPPSDRLRRASARGLQFALHAIAQRCGAVDRPKSRVLEMLRLLHPLALAIVTVIACVGMTGPLWGVANLLATPIDVTAPESGDAERRAWAPESSDDWQHGAVRAFVDFETEESDLDDEEAPLFEIAAALAFGCVSVPPRPDANLRGEPPIDTSRFASGTVLPSGPPTT